MNEHRDDELLALYRKTSVEQPPALLDARVRREAQRRAKRKPAFWIWGLSTAAVLVLSFSVVLQLQDEPGPSHLMEDIGNASSLPDLSGANVADQEAVEQYSPPEQPRSAVKAKPSPAVVAPRQQKKQSRQELEVARSPAAAVAEEQSQADKPAQTAPDDFPASFQAGREALASAPAPEPGMRGSGAGGLIDSVKGMPALNGAAPELPLSLEGIRALSAEVDARRSADGAIRVYHEQTLIAKIETDSDRAYIQLWRGASRLGLALNWNLDPAQLDTCLKRNGTLECRVDQRVTAFFDQGGLERFAWTQPLK